MHDLAARVTQCESDIFFASVPAIEGLLPTLSDDTPLLDPSQATSSDPFQEDSIATTMSSIRNMGHRLHTSLSIPDSPYASRPRDHKCTGAIPRRP